MKLSNVNLKLNSNIDSLFLIIYGVGKGRSVNLSYRLGLSKFFNISFLLAYYFIVLIQYILEENYLIWAALSRIELYDLDNIVNSGSYKGIRYLQGLPMRGQRTVSNSKTRKYLKTNKQNRLVFSKLV